MIYHSHVKIAEKIYETIVPDDHVWISKRAFIKGANAPDAFNYRFKGKHILDQSADYFASLVEEILDGYKPRHYLGHLLGEVMHFIADYTCSFHANPNFNTMYVHPVHLAYEIKLHRILRKMPVTITPFESIHLDTLISDLTDYTLRNHLNDANPKHNIVDAYNLSYTVFHRIFDAYKAKHIHQTRKTPLKIAIFTDTFLPQINGVSNTLYEYAKYLESHQVQYMILSPEVSKDDPKHPFVKRLKSIQFWFYKEARVVFMQHKKVFHVLDEFNPNIIHVMTEFGVGRIGVKYAEKHHIPLVSNYSSHFALFLKHLKLSAFVRPLEWYLSQFHKRSVITTTPSLDAKSLLQTKMGVSNVHIFSRGIDAKKFNPHQRSNALRKAWNAENRIVYACVSRIAGEKNLELAFESFQAMEATAKQNSLLVITGDGPLLEHYQKKYPWALFTGYKTGHDLAQIYASADVFVFPSATETLGNVVLEAQASGCVPIVVNRGGVLMNVDHEVNGLITDYTAPYTFKDAMERLYHDAPLRERLKTASVLASQAKSWPKVFNELMGVYRTLL